VVLLHVLEGGIPSPLYAHYHPTPSPEQLREEEAEARRRLAALVPARGRRVPHSLHLVRGAPADEICRAAEAEGASLIVIASHGRSGLRRYLIGSVAERVARHASCSVLLLRGAGRRAARGKPGVVSRRRPSARRASTRSRRRTRP
jgi:nucleotide-binding universal stress UspA family protein